MVRISFESVIPEHAVILGPAPYFRISGHLLRQGPENEIVGHYQNHFWEIQDDLFSRCDLRTPASIHFEDAFGAATDAFGPFEHLFISDGVVYADHKPFARFIEDRRCWLACNTEACWPVLLIH